MRRPQDRKGWEVVYRAPDEWQAELACRLLMEEGIPAIIQSSMVTGYANILAPQVGQWGEVLCPLACHDAAMAVLDSFCEQGGREGGTDDEKDAD